MKDSAPATPRRRPPASKPQTPLPAGAWDCHAHVFGPFDRFPLSAERRYEPPLAPAEDYLAMLDAVGFANGVVVHASAKGFDMANVANTIVQRRDRLIGVAVPVPDAGDAEFAALHDQGFRAVRITETAGHAGRSHGTLYFDDLARLAPRLREMGWHAQIWGRCDLVMAQRAMLEGCGLPIIFDHLGYPETGTSVSDAAFQTFLRWLPTGDFWVKTTPIRIDRAAPHYPQARQFFAALLEAVPDRLVFGSDWPYLSLDDDPPDVGRMVDLIDSWTGDATLRHKIFVANPRAFYWR